MGVAKRMKNIEQALYEFFSSFGVQAFAEASVPTGDEAPAFPYITYSVSISDFGIDTSLTANVYTRSTSWTRAVTIKNAIYNDLGKGGKLIPCDDGVIWLKRGTPFSSQLGDESDNLIKRELINITAEYLTV